MVKLKDFHMVNSFMLSYYTFRTFYIRVKEERNSLHTIKRRKVKWIYHILCGNCLLYHIMGEERQRRMDVTG